MYVGPFSIPIAAAAASATATTAATSSAGSSLGQTCASATPNAGGSATMRSVTVSGWKRPPTENAFTVTSGPATSSSTSTTLDRASPRARSNASASASAARDEREPLLALQVGRLDDAREAELAPPRPAASDRLEQTRWRACGTPGLGEALALAELRRRRLRRRAASSGCGSPSRPAMRAAIATGKSIPGATIAVDALRRREPVDRGLVLDGDDRAAVGEAEPRRARVAVDGDDVEAAIVRGLEQPELRRPGP